MTKKFTDIANEIEKNEQTIAKLFNSYYRDLIIELEKVSGLEAISYKACEDKGYIRFSLSNLSYEDALARAIAIDDKYVEIETASGIYVRIKYQINNEPVEYCPSEKTLKLWSSSRWPYPKKGKAESWKFF